VKVYLLLLQDRSRPLFYSEDPEASADDGEGDGAAPGGDRPPRGWLERTARRIKATILTRGRRAGPRTRRVLAWLNRRPAPDEPLLRGLRRAGVVELYHPSLLTLRRARREWNHYLARRRRRAMLASLWDWLLALVALPMVLLPGPNVVGLWFAYRGLTHLLVIRGIWRVETHRIATEYHADEALDEPLPGPRGAEVERAAAALGLKNLSNFLRLSERHRRGTPEDPPPPDESAAGLPPVASGP
jgi:hypothetical protein